MAAVNNAANNEAFQRLSEIFDYEESVSPLEVEILPKALSSSSSNEVLRDGHCIGIPKAMLVSAFVAARCLLFGGRVHAGDDGDRGSLPDELLHFSTATILLFDPEHLSAANARKRHLRRLLSDTAGNSSLEDALKRELWLLDSFLTSPLPKHPKSPTLWSHRRWLLTEHWKLIASLHDRDTEPEQTRRQDPGSRLLSRELHVVLKAAERHQHNYHAWNYLRKLVRQFISTDSSSPDIDTALRDCVEMVHSWCTQHPRDVSGWSFLLFLLRLAKDSELAGDIIELVAKRAISLQFGGEAVWGFIMHAVEREGFLDWGTTIEVLEAMKAYLGELQGKEARHGRTGRALSTEEKRLVRWIGRLQ